MTTPTITTLAPLLDRLFDEAEAARAQRMPPSPICPTPTGRG